MTAKFQIVDTDGKAGATIFLNGETHVVDDDHPEWSTITQHLINRIDDDETLLGLIVPAIEVSNKLTALSERFALRGETVLFDGDPIDNALAGHLLGLVKAGSAERGEKGYEAFVRFAEKLYTNPSELSREHAFKFMQANKITIHEDGDLIAYKGVRNDGLSTRSGYGIVNGEIFENAYLDNSVGNIVSIPRSMVDDNRSATCSVGLHVGAWSYAKSFSSKMLTVKVNPRDIVSVPHDEQDRKMRVSRYEVLEEAPSEPYGLTLELPKVEEPENSDPISSKWDEGTADENDPESDLKVSFLPEVSTQKLNAIKIPEGFEKEDFRARVQRMVALIGDLPSGTKLRRYRNKNVTGRNRLAFDAAVKALGLNY